MLAPWEVAMNQGRDIFHITPADGVLAPTQCCNMLVDCLINHGDN